MHLVGVGIICILDKFLDRNNVVAYQVPTKRLNDPSAWPKLHLPFVSPLWLYSGFIIHLNIESLYHLCIRKTRSMIPAPMLSKQGKLRVFVHSASLRWAPFGHGSDGREV